MNRYIFSGFVVLLFPSQLLTAQDVAARNHEPPALGLALGQGLRHAGGSHRSPNMTWHNGAIITSSAATAIFWGTSWGNSSFVRR
jgi:hypothetical protein